MTKINSIFGDITREIIDYIYTQTKKNGNKKKIKYIIEKLSDLVFEELKPYLYTILSILILTFLMNGFNFYYYIRLMKPGLIIT